MRTPYRSAEEPLARYPLRTHASYYALLGAAALMVVPAALVFVSAGPLDSATTWLALLIAVAAPVAAWDASRQLRVPDGAELRLHRDRVELPGRRRGDVLAVPIGEVHASLVRHPSSVVVVGLVPVGVGGGVSLRFAFRGGARVLSHRVFGSVEVAERAFADVLRVQQGLAPEGPAGRPPPAAEASDEYDRRIEEELRRMD